MGSKKLWIYSQAVTPRLEYVAEVLFSSILGIGYEITGDRRKIGSSPALVYSDEKVKEPFVIRPAGLVHSDGIVAAEPEVTWKGETPLLFPVIDGSLPFDIFSAAFYMLSRYEEYLPFTSDAHGRFPGSSSFAYRNNFLHLPVVELWARMLAAALVKNYPEITIRHNEYRPLLTVDVDQPYAYRSRGFLRTVGGLVRGFSGSGPRPAQRIRIMRGEVPDPYDTFDYISSKAEESGCDTMFFFPVGDQGDYDHNPPYRDRDYNSVIKRFNSASATGIHPSYHSFGRPDVLAEETRRFGRITGKQAEAARQHWLLLKMPYTYRAYIDAGIKYDYTMGYADEPGFRAGMARPFPFYDLADEKVTGLTVVPFHVMDGTLRQYRHLTAEAAVEVTAGIIENVRAVGGLFVSVWHNTSLTGINGWEGWRTVFEKTLEMQRQ